MHGISMRNKGRIMFGVVVVYALLIALFVFHQKSVLLREFDNIGRELEVHAAVSQLDIAAYHVLTAVRINEDTVDRRAALRRIESHYAQLEARHLNLMRMRPDFALRLSLADQAMARARAAPSAINLKLLAAELERFKDALTAEVERARRAHRQAAQRYRTKTDALAVMTLVLGLAGLAVLGAIPGVFFKRLTEDLHALQARALEIMRGYRGAPLPIRRGDELGQLMQAVNEMASTLGQREKELVVERQKVVHQEKMAAIGTLAAGVAHEIGNPIAAMSGVLQELAERPHTCAGGVPCDRCRFDLIQAQIERLAGITREISEFAAPGTTESQLLDLNAQVRSTVALLRYDRRMQNVALELDLDAQLPAVQGIPDQLAQVIMNLLINAADAIESAGGVQPRVVLRTRLEDGQACLDVIDNGPGMSPEVRAQAFEAFFTTKPAGKGTGLGLSLCHSIVQAHGGGVDIDSTEGVGTRVRVALPVAM